MKSETYDEFVEKFKPKKTTDDCYTPPLVYDVVREWACDQFNIDPGKIVRPFYPGGDYENFDYSNGAVVLDNPPFSIISKICEFYLNRKIPFFLFAPSLTVFSGKNICLKITHIVCDADIEYDNGAIVHTAFVTNLGGDIVAISAPDLHRKVAEAVETLRKEKRRELPKYTYPDNVLTSSMLKKISKYGIEYQVRRGECAYISALDSQRKQGKAVFGNGLLLSQRKAKEKAAAEKAAAKKAAAEKANATVWKLSPREKEIIGKLV